MMSYGYGGGGGGGGSGGGGGGASGGGGGAAGGGGAGAGGGSGSAAGGGAGEQPPLEPIPVGAFRFNPSTAKLEYWDGNQFVNITTTSPEQHTGGTRGIQTGVNTHPAWDDHMDFFNISTTGNAIDFGNMQHDTFNAMATSSRTRGLSLGGYHPSTGNANNIISFVTIASQGNAADFGDLTVGRNGGCSHCDGTRAVMVGGDSAPNATTQDVIDYVTVSTLGNAQDFGDIGGTFGNTADGGCGTPTRGVFHAREPSNTGRLWTVNMSSQGNLVEFGSTALSGNNTYSGCSNSIRGIWAGAYNKNQIVGADLTSFGSAFDFGDLLQSIYGCGAASSPTRGVFIGGAIVPSYSMTNVLQMTELMSKGDTVDFGDLNFSGYLMAGMSNGHGGLG